jgi:hypothetical protein
MPYPVLQTSLDNTAPYGQRYCWHSGLLPALRDDAIAQLADAAATLPAAGCLIHVHALGGVLAGGGGDEPTAGLRAAKYLVKAVAGWPDAADSEQMRAWASRVRDAACAPDAREYVNFTADAGALPKQSFSDSIRRRLESIRSDYDPARLFA